MGVYLRPVTQNYCLVSLRNKNMSVCVLYFYFIPPPTRCIIENLKSDACQTVRWMSQATPDNEVLKLVIRGLRYSMAGVPHVIGCILLGYEFKSLPSTKEFPVLFRFFHLSCR